MLLLGHSSEQDTKNFPRVTYSLIDTANTRLPFSAQVDTLEIIF